LVQVLWVPFRRTTPTFKTPGSGLEWGSVVECLLSMSRDLGSLAASKMIKTIKKKINKIPVPT
jgi:hypothetical protein